ncbi:DEAD/DEAH box helicase [Archangium lansingense]|uniref:DEAD/DEAH box helicase n=1 Tax=Archangium lansingense TaxID=2995310 RepID=A0ABT4A5E4_9BACT|nr:DEAD/DEAH box helicase [Archangium lansinium]MCY1076840.1 DEAD/DEAH box helicase [Archangium lansinium]
MMPSAQTRDDRRVEPASAPREIARAERFDVRLRFGVAAEASRYLRAITSLLFGGSTKVTATLTTGAPREDLTAEEIADRLSRGAIDKLRFALRLGERPLHIELALPASEPGAVALRAPFTNGPVTSRLWLQSDADVVAPVPALALPTTTEGLAIDAVHALVGLAVRCGGFHDAELAGEHPLTWNTTKPHDDAQPVRSALRDAVWSTAPQAEGAVALWVTGLPPPPKLRTPEAGWWEQYDVLTRSPRQVLTELHAHLATQFEIPCAWTILDITAAPEGSFVVQPEASAIARLVPEANRVVVAVDLEQPASLVAEMLLHLCAHLTLGHVRPGDAWGHWDTQASLSPTPHRQWDREARAYVDAHFARPVRRVSSLEECNPREKAWLVLLDHIGRMVGQTRMLHAATERYQAAAYQRQAAQRLVAQLEEYGGAMLCDGVGLGKTYVATTVAVHYANQWRDQLADARRSATDDPFRVTVLSPNSVVSTWQREAIAPLAAHGVPLATIRVLSHSKLSRIVPSSDILTRGRSGMSDMEHLLLSDLVVVDEAHNFRSVGARRTTVLRDLLRLQPRKEPRRKVLLLTATPVNNSLEDLRQQAALMFGKPLFFNDNLTPDKYRARVFKDVEERVAKAAKGKGAADVAALLIHGDASAKFAYAPDFRDDVQFGVQVPRVGDYLKEQEKRLMAQQAAVRAAIQSGHPPTEAPARIAGELLDRIVVQRSRALCKQIEREQGSNARLLFRPDAATPEKLVYEDVYDDTRDVLARFLPLFETEDEAAPKEVPPLSLKVYMWADVRDGISDAGEVSSVVGLQRVLVLKRLESSPVAFLITLLRLLALHAHRLKQLAALCREVGDKKRESALAAELASLIAQVSPVDRERIDALLTGGTAKARDGDLLERWSNAHMSAKAAADTDDPLPPQLDLFGEDEKTTERREQLDRLWSLRENLARDLATLLSTAPSLADIVFGRFAQSDWPHRFINGGQQVDWPTSAAWAMRIVTDAKLQRLVSRLLRARKDGQKVIVFSQFTDTLAYLDSVLRAAPVLERNEWKTVLRELSAGAGHIVSKDEVLDLIGRIAVVSGETEERDAVIHAFAPFYRLGPSRPRLPGASTIEQQQLDALWSNGWTQALKQPIDVLFATDVLAEGVNLQDAALLINFDVHWNPVRMIQRAGRIDRRLNPAIEEATSFPDLEALARDLGVEPPRYWWHAHTGAAPVTVNLLLPDELEAELQLRERIANKTLAIDFTLGLEQGTGAEADWMAEYRYQGISALNAWQGDRAIEQIAGYQQRLRRLLSERGIEAEWLAAWNGWLREVGGRPDDCIIAWANLGRKGGDAKEYTRQLQPRLVGDVPHWLWTAEKPVEWSKNFWLVLDSNTHPAATRKGLGFSEDASRPVAAEDLLTASRRVVDGEIVLEELGREVGRPFQQGASAVAAGVFSEEDRRAIQIRGFRILQVRHVDAAPATVRPSEESC